MKLHYHPVSPYSRKALVTVYHRQDQGLDTQVELVELDVNGGALQAPAYQRLSPYGKMPLLETNGGPLIESTSIIEYIENQGERLLIPDAIAPQVRHYDRLGDLYMLEPCNVLFFQPDTAKSMDAQEVIVKTWALFERTLKNRPFLCGDVLTLGDLAGAIGTDLLLRMGYEVPQPITAWHERCFAVPAMDRSIQEALPVLEPVIAMRQRDIEQSRAWSGL